MGWTEMVAGANQTVVDTFKDTVYPTATLTPAAGGGPYAVPTVETETNLDERVSSGNVTQLFFYLANLTALSAPVPIIGDSITWKGQNYRITKVSTDPEDGIKVVVRKV